MRCDSSFSISTGAAVAVDAATLERAPGPMAPVAFRVAGRRDETADVVTLDLEPAGATIAEPRPGQFAMIYAFGVGEVPISVSGCPADDGVLRHTVRAVGAVTRALCDLRPGDEVGVRGPFGRGWPVDAVASGVGADGAAPDLVVVGGGIGFAPLRPVVQRAAADRDRFDRVAIVVGARTADDLLFRDELMAWRSRFDLAVEVTVDAGTNDWHGDVGVVTKVLPRVPFDPARAVAMLCGPEVMMRVVARDLLDAGVAAERIHVSLERNMRCGIRQCGHCQLGPVFVCADGPVVPWSTAAPLLEVRRW